jgi:hypothetical protein
MKNIMQTKRKWKQIQNEIQWQRSSYMAHRCHIPQSIALQQYFHLQFHSKNLVQSAANSKHNFQSGNILRQDARSKWVARRWRAQRNTCKTCRKSLKRTEIFSFVERDFPHYSWSLRSLDRRLRHFNIYYQDRNVTVAEVRHAVKKWARRTWKTASVSRFT